MASSRRASAPEPAAERVNRWLDGVRMLSEERHGLVQALRQAVLAQVTDAGPNVVEEVKYGGLLFSSGQPFCGIYSYTAHVSLEFGQGATLADPMKVLEGAGKRRRHIKLRHIDDLARCQVDSYLREALFSEG